MSCVSYNNTDITYYRFRKELRRWTSFMVFDNYNRLVVDGYYDHHFKEMVTYDRNGHISFWTMIDLVRCMNNVYKQGKAIFFDNNILRSKRYGN